MIKKIKLVCMALCTIFILTGCASQSPSDVVNQYFKEIKEGTNADVSKYLMESIEEQTNTVENTEEDNELIDVVFSKLDAKVLNENVDGDTATVEVELTGVNFGNIMLEVIQESIGNMFSGTESTEEDMTNLMLNKAKNSELQTRTGKINLSKVDKKWQIETDEDVMTLMLGTVE